MGIGQNGSPSKPENIVDSFIIPDRKEGSGSTTLRIVPADYNGLNSADSTTHGSGQAQALGSKYHNAHSVHGDTAAKRRAITELLFFASVGDLRRCQRIVRLWNLDVSDPACADYDKRTPLHLASSEGAYAVTEWLMAKKANVNAVDRFHRTPMQDAVIGSHAEVVKLLQDNGGKILEHGELVPLEDSQFSASAPQLLDPSSDWEVDSDALVIKEKIGEGEFGVVHKAIWNGTVVAAKVLKGSDAIALGDFRGELDVLRRVHHPNAVQFLGAQTANQPFVLVTELMYGKSLADAFKFTQVFTVRRSLEICLDTARGLAYLHTRKPAPIIHRGSPYHKPFELMFNSGVVKLADFGLSKTLPINKHAKYDLEDKFKLTGETGSYRYMAPEVFRHEPYNNKVDVYSFSMIIYQLFEHQAPFYGMDPVDAARAAALQELRPEWVIFKHPKTPVQQEIRALIEECWAPDPEDRPQFVDVVDKLEDIMSKVPRSASAPKQHFTEPSDTQKECCSVQ